MITPINTFRTVIFPDLATANASNRLIGWGEMAVILGDNTRVKFGSGYRNSAKNPAAPTAPTFANLPWSYTDGAAVKAPTAAFTYSAPATATLTAAQLLKKYIVTSSAAATSLTLPTAAALNTAIGALAGTEVDFTVDNTNGANTVTIVVNTGIVVGAGALTGNTTLTIAAGQVGKFKIFFKSNAAALLYRTL